MNFTKKLSILSYLFLFVIAFGHAEEHTNNVLEKSMTSAALSEDGVIYYGQRIKVQIFRPDPTNEIINSAISGVPFGLQFDPSTGVLEGVVDIEEDKTYPFENILSVDLTYQDETSLKFKLSIFTVIPFVDAITLVNTADGNRIKRLENNDTINYVTDGKDIAIRAGGNFEFPDPFFGQLEIQESLALDFYLNGSYFKRENVAPYAFNGDVNGVYNPLSLKEGTYTIGTRLYSKALGVYVSDVQEIVLNIVNPVGQVPEINGIAGNLPRFLGSTVDFAIDATDPNGRALSYKAINLPEVLRLDSKTGQITGALDLNSTDISSRRFTVEVSNGLYSDTIEIQIPRLQEPVINAITMVNSITDLPIKGYENIPVDSSNTVGIEFEITNDRKSFNVVAHTNVGAIVGGLLDFTVDGRFAKRERVAPYALAGDLSGNYLTWKYPQDDIPSLGFQRVEASVTIKKSTSKEVVGQPVLLSFILKPNMNDTDADEIIKGLTLSPNPATDYIDINNLSPDRELGLLYQITSIMTGRIVKEDFIGFSTSRIDISDLPVGMYAIVIATESGISLESFNAKFIKQ